MWEILTGEEPYANMHCGAIIGKDLLCIITYKQCLSSEFLLPDSFVGLFVLS